jgi:hypothetical protein
MWPFDRHRPLRVQRWRVLVIDFLDIDRLCSGGLRLGTSALWPNLPSHACTPDVVLLDHVVDFSRY